jgi:hypothetical protein
MKSSRTVYCQLSRSYLVASLGALSLQHSNGHHHCACQHCWLQGPQLARKLCTWPQLQLIGLAAVHKASGSAVSGLRSTLLWPTCI